MMRPSPGVSATSVPLAPDVVVYDAGIKKALLPFASV
jgi:hypothetical protein